MSVQLFLSTVEQQAIEFRNATHSANSAGNLVDLSRQLTVAGY